MIYKDGSYYTGQWWKDKPNGYGTMYYHDGLKYTGNWFNGNKDDQNGILIDEKSNLIVHKGLFYKDRNLSNGKYIYQNDDEYEGWHDKNDGYKHGFGKMIFSNQDVY